MAPRLAARLFGLQQPTPQPDDDVEPAPGPDRAVAIPAKQAPEGRPERTYDNGAQQQQSARKLHDPQREDAPRPPEAASHPTVELEEV